MKKFNPWLILISLTIPSPLFALEAAQLATCNYYQGEKVIKTDSSCIIYTVIDKGVYQGKILWQDETTITRFSGDLNASVSSAVVDNRPVKREDQGLGAYCYTFLDNGDRLCITLKN
jgi:hypothetical protein